MKDWRNALGLLGVGPFCVIPCLLATRLGLRRYGRSPLGRRGGALVIIPLVWPPSWPAWPYGLRPLSFSGSWLTLRPIGW